MKSLSKKQKKILTYLYEKSRVEEDAEYATLVNYLECNSSDAYTDIELLKDKGLVKFDPQFKEYVSITPKGIEKLQENFITRFNDAIHENPLAVIAIIISILSILANIYISIHTNQRTESLSIDLNEVKGKIAHYDTLVVKNSTMNELFIPCSNGSKPQITMYSGESGDVRNGIIFNGTFIECI